MNYSVLRRRLLKDGESEQDIEELLNEMTEQRDDEARDFAAEKHYRNNHDT